MAFSSIYYLIVAPSTSLYFVEKQQEQNERFKSSQKEGFFGC